MAARADVSRAGKVGPRSNPGPYFLSVVVRDRLARPRGCPGIAVVYQTAARARLTRAPAIATSVVLPARQMIPPFVAGQFVVYLRWGLP
jgi:hypothetical protein